MGLPVSVTLRVNPIACAGHGMCAELLPEIIELDPWGYPILASPECAPRPATITPGARWTPARPWHF